MKTIDTLILGAGCAGTSLAHHLESSGYTEKIVLLDSRTKFDREQRWCSWAKMPESLSPLIQKCWAEWTVCDENRAAIQTSENYSYQQIYAPEFFSHFHSRWQTAPALVEMSLGENVERIEENNDFVEVKTSHEIWRAKRVFDARHEGNANLEKAQKTNAIYLHQTFLGWTIEFSRPVFNEKNVTLMDFRTPQTDGVNFIYVLPYSDRKALVESTSFSQNQMRRSHHLQALTTYIAQHFGSDYEFKTEESGDLPMTTANLPIKSGERIFNIGVAGGSARPSSGYAFHRIQRQTAAIAAALVNQEPIPASFAPRKYKLFDAIFLASLARKPDYAKESFLRMFDHVAPDSLIRFLTDESSYADDLALIAALPKIHFGATIMQSLWRKFAAGNESHEKIQLPYGALPDSVGKPARRLAAQRVER